MWNLKYDTKKISTKQKQIHRYREQTWSCQGGAGREGKERSLGLAQENILWKNRNEFFSQHDTLYRRDKQQAPPVEQELYSIFWDNQNEKEYIYIYMYV